MVTRNVQQCAEFGEWQNELTDWGVFGTGSVFSLLSIALLVRWSAETVTAYHREIKRREEQSKQPWLSQKGISTHTIVCFFMVTAQLASVVYYSSGFGIARATLCEWGAFGQALLNSSHATITAANFAVVCE